MKKELRQLWKTAFGDTDRYIKYYFSSKADKSHICTDWEGDTLCAMAFFTPYSVMYRGKECVAPYLVGVATDERFRRQGKMTKVLTEGLLAAKEEGAPVAFLCPENPEVYKKLGFCPAYYRETFITKKRGTQTLSVTSYMALDETEQDLVVKFTANCLESQKFDLYMKRSRMYYAEVCRELQALDGELLVLREQKRIVAVVNLIHEDEYEVTECVALPEYTEPILDSLTGALQTERIWIEDTHFLKPGDYVEIEKQEKPYIMILPFNESWEDVMTCYINDIT